MVDHALGLEVVLERVDLHLLVSHVSLHFHLEEAYRQLIHVFVR